MSDSTLIQPSSLNRSNMYAFELRNSPIYCPRNQSSAFQTRQFKRRRKKTSWLKMFRELSVYLIHGPELHVKMSCYQQSTHTHSHTLWKCTCSIHNFTIDTDISMLEWSKSIDTKYTRKQASQSGLYAVRIGNVLWWSEMTNSYKIDSLGCAECVMCVRVRAWVSLVDNFLEQFRLGPE